MASGCMKQASGAYVRKQGQRLWQLNYRRKLNAYNRVAFRDAHRKGTMQFTHLGLEFLPFSDSMGNVSCLSAPPQGHPKRSPKGTHRPRASVPHMVLSVSHPDRSTFPDSHCFTCQFPQKSDINTQMGPCILFNLTP